MAWPHRQLSCLQSSWPERQRDKRDKNNRCTFEEKCIPDAGATTGKPALLDWVIATACSNGGQAAPKAPTFWHRQELPRMDRGPYKVLWYRWSGRRPPGRSPWRAFGPKPFSWDCTHLRSSSIQWCPFCGCFLFYTRLMLFVFISFRNSCWHCLYLLEFVAWCEQWTWTIC